MTSIASVNKRKYKSPLKKSMKELQRMQKRLDASNQYNPYAGSYTDDRVFAFKKARKSS